MKALTKIGLSLFMLSFAAIFIFFISIIFAIPLWVSSSNSTTPASPATYNPLANYSFAINWTDVANASFQLGSPNGGLTNYTDNTTGLVGYWRLNAVNGTNYTKDFSGYGNDGKLKNYAQCGSGASTCNLTAGKFGNGLQFDGVNDYVDAGNGASLNITNAITVGAWIYQQPEDIPAGSRKTIAAKRTSSPTNNGYLLSLVDDGGTEGYRFWVDGITAKWSTTLLSGQWVYVTGVYNSTKVIIYVNGIERVSTSKTGNIGTTTNALNIGRDVFNGIYFFNGTIDEVRVYNRSLSAQEISTLYNMQYPYYAGTDDSLNGTWAINYTQSSIGGAGVYNYTWFGTDTAGLQNGTQTIGYNITKAIPILTMSNTTNSINTSGMVLYMPFSEGSGASVTEDKSGWGNNGTLTNMNTTGNSTSGWIAGKYGSGLQFDGIDDFVNMGNSSILDIKDTKDIYVSFWFKSNPDTVVRDIIEKYDYVNIKGWKLYMFYSGIDQLNYINYEVNGGGFAGGASNGYGGFSSNKWNNIIFFRNSNNLGIILNGIVVLNDTGSYDFSNIENLTIGEKKGDDSYFNGIIDEVRIYNRSLSADEIKMQYNSSKYYPFTSNVSASIDNSEQTLNLYRYENTSLASPFDSQILGAGQYWYIANASSTQNYTKIETLLPFEISQNNTNPINLWFRNATNQYLNQKMTIIYESSSNTTAVMPYQQSGAVNLYYNDTLNSTLNNTNMTLGAAVYNITANTTGNQNYTSNSTSFLLAINKFGLNLIVNPQTSTITYPTSTLQYCSANATLASCNLYRNSSLITNNTNIILGAAVYNFTANITDTQNYTIWQNSSLLTINRNTSFPSLFSLNDTYINMNETDLLNISFPSGATLNAEIQTPKSLLNRTLWYENSFYILRINKTWLGDLQTNVSRFINITNIFINGGNYTPNKNSTALNFSYATTKMTGVSVLPSPVTNNTGQIATFTTYFNDTEGNPLPNMVCSLGLGAYNYAMNYLNGFYNIGMPTANYNDNIYNYNITCSNNSYQTQSNATEWLKIYYGAGGTIGETSGATSGGAQGTPAGISCGENETYYGVYGCVLNVTGFSAIPQSLSFNLMEGESRTGSVQITNLLNKNISVSIYATGNRTDNSSSWIRFPFGNMSYSRLDGINIISKSGAYSGISTLFYEIDMPNNLTAANYSFNIIIENRANGMSIFIPVTIIKSKSLLAQLAELPTKVMKASVKLPKGGSFPIGLFAVGGLGIIVLYGMLFWARRGLGWVYKMLRFTYKRKPSEKT